MKRSYWLVFMLLGFVLTAVIAVDNAHAAPVKKKTNPAEPAKKEPVKDLKQEPVITRTSEEDLPVDEDLAEEAEKAESSPEPPAPVKRTKQELVDIIKKRLKTFPEILNMMPGLMMKKTASGEPEYFFTKDGKDLSIKDLDMEVLESLYRNVNSKATLLNSERIQKILVQQEQIVRMQNLQRQANPPSVPQMVNPMPPMPPTAPRAPQTVSSPTPVPPPVSAPNVPPQIPQRPER